MSSKFRLRFLDTLKRHGSQKSAARKKRRLSFRPFRLALEPLEDRMLLAAIQSTLTRVGDFVVADVNNDGISDIVAIDKDAVDAALLIGRGDGTFDRVGYFRIGRNPEQIVAADFNKDRFVDLAVMDVANKKAHILLGRGDGTFPQPITFEVVDNPTIVLHGDFDGDTRVDIVYWSDHGDDPSRFWLMPGNGDGTFQREVQIGRAQGVKDAIAADLDADGITDVAYIRNQPNPQDRSSNAPRSDPRAPKAGNDPGQIGIFYGTTNRRPQSRTVTIDHPPASIAAGDVNNDGLVDLVSNNLKELVVLLAKTGREYQTEQHFIGLFPLGSVRAVADIDLDSILDVIATPFARSTQLILFRGLGNGTFKNPEFIGVGNQPLDLATATFDEDGRPDLAVVFKDGGIAALMGSNAGAFVTPSRYAVDKAPGALVNGDFNRDGRNDIATVNYESNDISILLGHGDGHFTVMGTTYAVGVHPRHLIAADFNNDGRLDIATADEIGVRILFGLGDGSFGSAKRLSAIARPTFLATADFDADGYADIAVASPGGGSRPGTITVMLGSANGEFRVARALAVGRKPMFLVTGDFNGDGRIDVASANRHSMDVSVALGNGDGTFTSAVPWAVGGSPMGLVIGDYTGDQIVDLVTVAVSRAKNVMPRLVILSGDGQGTFGIVQRRLVTKNPHFEPKTPQRRLIPVPDPRFLRAGDLDADGIPDLVVTEPTADHVLLGTGFGRFHPERSESVAIPTGTVIGQFDGDGLPDMAVSNRTDEVAIFAGLGNGRFTALHTEFSPIKPSPWFVDLSNDGVKDLLSFDRVGNLIFRAGQPGKPAVFDPPVFVNSTTRVRDLTPVQGPNGSVRVAALNAAGTGIFVYEPDNRGPKLSIEIPLDGLRTQARATQIESADFNLDGRNDLVVLRSGTASSIAVYLANEAGSFDKLRADFPVEFGTTDIYVAKVNGDRLVDVVLVNQLSGLCTVMVNKDRGTKFQAGSPIWMGYGLAGRTEARTNLYGVTPDNTMGMVVTDLDRDGQVEMVAVNSGANEVTIVKRKPSGEYEAPSRVAIQTHPGSLNIADVNGDAFEDLILLDHDQIEVLLGDGKGSLKPQPVIVLQNGLSGLSVVSNVLGTPGREKISDLVISNALGDVVLLLGNGDGTFATPQSTAVANDKVSLAVVNRKDGEVQYIITDPLNDRVTINCATSGACFARDVKTGLDQPTAVSVADVDADGRLDLVVGDGGANNVLVYLGTADGKFGKAHQFGVGTNPVGLTLNDIDKNGLLDLIVANEGSNDVSILLGQTLGGKWTLAPGPRLRAGSGPVATEVADVTGPDGKADGVPDVLVANGRANTVFQFRGLGNGFFADQQPEAFAVGDAPVKFFINDFNGDGAPDLATLNNSSLTFVSGLNQSATSSLSTGGFSPTSAVVDDLDADGHADLLVAYEGEGALGLFRGSSGGFTNVERIASGLLDVSALVLSPFGGLFAADSDGTVSAVVLQLKDFVDGSLPLKDAFPATPALPFRLVPGLRDNEGIAMDSFANRADAGIDFEQDGPPVNEATSNAEDLRQNTDSPSPGGFDRTIDERPPVEWSKLHKRNRHMFGIRDAQPKQPDESEKNPLPETPAELDRQPRSELPKETIEAIVPASIPAQETRVAPPLDTLDAIGERTRSGTSLGILLSLLVLNQYAGTLVRQKKKTASPLVDREPSTADKVK